MDADDLSSYWASKLRKNIGHIKLIAGQAGIPVDELLISSIAEVATEYQLEKARQPIKTSETKAHLRAATKYLDLAIRHLNALGASGHSLLAGAYRVHPQPGTNSPRRRAKPAFQTLHDDTEAATRLASVCREIVLGLPEAGAPNVWVRDRMFEQLAEVYQSRSGRQFQYPGKRDRYRGADFLRSSARLIEPNLTDKECNHSLRAARTILRRLAKMEEYRPSKRA